MWVTCGLYMVSLLVDLLHPSGTGCAVKVPRFQHSSPQPPMAGLFAGVVKTVCFWSQKQHEAIVFLGEELKSWYFSLQISWFSHHKLHFHTYETLHHDSGLDSVLLVLLVMTNVWSPAGHLATPPKLAIFRSPWHRLTSRWLTRSTLSSILRSEYKEDPWPWSHGKSHHLNIGNHVVWV